MHAQVETENALDRFVQETRELFERESDPETRWTALRPVLAKLLADPEVIAASKHWPECVDENLLFYEDPDFGFVVNGLTKAEAVAGPGRYIHDHAHIYTLYGVLDGHERIERFERIDDRSKADYAEIKRTENLDVGPGEIDLVRPYEIHGERSVGERTVAIIIRSEKTRGFNQGLYDLETNHYREGLGPHQTAYDMLPKAPA